MTAEYHYDQLTDLLAARGMARYTESHEAGRAFIADGMEVKAKAAIPMSAMWTAAARSRRTNGTTPTSASPPPSLTSTARTSWRPNR